MNLNAIQEIFPGIPSKDAPFYRMVNEGVSSAIDEIGFSLLVGWRYNPRNEFGVLYLSMNPDCCLKEKIKQAGGKPENLRPQILGLFQIHLEHCLDLTDEKNLTRIGIDFSQLIATDDFNLTQTISREARRVGFEGILAPSAIGKECVNLVVYKDKLSRKSFCELKETKPVGK